MKKEIIPQPYIQDMTYDEDCWLIIDCRGKENKYVTFYNAKQDSDKEYETIKEYAKTYIENEFSNFDVKNVEYSENGAIASGCSLKEEEDYDEETGRLSKSLNIESQIINIMRGVKLENIVEIIKKTEEKLNNIEIDAKYDAAVDAEENKDPYKYRGLSKKDFM